MEGIQYDGRTNRKRAREERKPDGMAPVYAFEDGELEPLGANRLSPSSSFLTDACAKSDLGLTLEPGVSKGLRETQDILIDRHLLPDLLVPERLQLGRARAHDVIRGGDVLLGPARTASC